MRARRGSISGGSDTLIIAWGNPARRDDGLGPALAQVMAEEPGGTVDVEVDYQLQVEHAADVARYRRVIFVDADRVGDEPFSMRRIRASGRRAAFSTHSASPESILTVSRDLFAAEPEAWLLGIRGYEFGGFGETLSSGASGNLNAAIGFLRKSLLTDTFATVPTIRVPVTEERGEDPCKTAST